MFFFQVSFTFFCFGWFPWYLRWFWFWSGFFGFSGFSRRFYCFWLVSTVSRWFLVLGWFPWFSGYFHGFYGFLVCHGVHGRFMVGSWFFLVHAVQLWNMGKWCFTIYFFHQIPTRSAIAKDVFTKPIQILSMLSYPFVATVQRCSYVSIFRRRQVWCFFIMKN